MSIEPAGEVVNALAQKILDQLPVAVFVTDATGNPVYSNTRSTELIGRGVVDLEGSLAATYGVYRERTLEPYPDTAMPISRALMGGHVVAQDMELRHPDGTTIAIEVSAGPIHDEAGEITNAVSAFWDITKRKEVERDSALLSAIFESTGDTAIVSFGLSGLITRWNAGAQWLYGYSPEEAIGAPDSILVPAEFDDGQVAPGSAHPYREVSRVGKDGTMLRVGEISTSIVDGEGRTVGVACIARDVSARLETEAALAETRVQLEHHNRQLERSNAELEQFAYVASHDLSEPLRAIAGMVSLLERRYKGQLDADADEFIAFAVDGCQRMQAMIEDLLAFSRISRRGTRLQNQIDMAAAARTALDSMAFQIDEARAVVTLGDLPTVRGDSSQMTQLFQNLLTNAVKFRRPDVSPEIRVHAERDDDAWRFTVSDNGIGIDEQYQTRIFRMFQRLHTTEAYAGTGIGLAIAERIVDRHGGSIGVTGTLGGGSTFWFTIPDLPEAYDQ